MSVKLMKLSNRLSAVAGFVEKGSCIADIGTDHGYLPVYLAQNGLAGRIVASDISAGSLKSAIESAAKYGVADKITFIAAPGLAGVGEADADTIVLAGMGGETISRILSGAPWTKRPGIRLIMQPQSKLGELCSWLRDNGYALHDAELAHEKGRFYIVMLAGAREERGERRQERGELGNDGAGTNGHQYKPIIPNSEFRIPNFKEAELLSLLAHKGDSHFPEYLDELISKARRAAEGMARAGASEYTRMKKRVEELENLSNGGL